MKKLFILLIITLLLNCSCSKTNTTNERMLDNVLKENNYIVVDVRTKEEYNSGHVKNSINIPYDEITADTNLDKNKSILVYCRSGVRSKKAYNTLKKLGYDTYDLGGYDSVTLEKE